MDVPPVDVPLAGEPEEEVIGPGLGAPTVSLTEAVRIALERNFGILGSADSVLASRYRESAAKAQFYPRITPRYQRNAGTDLVGLDITQRLPWSGATLTAAGTLTGTPENQNPFPRASDIRLVVTQPLLRGFGPNATFYDLQQQPPGPDRPGALLRAFERQRLAVQVTAAFYQRDRAAAARVGLPTEPEAQREPAEGLRRAAQGRAGEQARRLPGRAAGLADRGCARALRGRPRDRPRAVPFSPGPPSGPIPWSPRRSRLEETLPGEEEPLEILIQRAFDRRLELRETRDQVADASRSAALARQNLLPQLDLRLWASAASASARPTARPTTPATRGSTSSSPPRIRSSARTTRRTRRWPTWRSMPASAWSGSVSWRSSPRYARGARPGAHPQERRAAAAGGGDRGPAAPARHPALSARPGQQLRRGGRGGQPGPGPQRAGEPPRPPTRWPSST